MINAKVAQRGSAAQAVHDRAIGSRRMHLVSDFCPRGDRE
jgi:hypothetical protein